MYSVGKLFGKLFVKLHSIFWWIAIWGITYIAIEYYSQKSKLRELSIYAGLLFILIVALFTNPDLIEQL